MSRNARSYGCTVAVDSSHGPDPHARAGGRGGRKCRAHPPLRRSRRPAPDAPNADRRRRAAGGLPLPAGRRRARDRRPGPAGEPARRAVAVLRPAARLLARRAPGDGRTPHLPPGVRAGLLQGPGARHGALGRRGAPRGDPRGARALRRQGHPPGRLEPRWDLRAARRCRPYGPADRVPDGDRLPRRRHQGAADGAGPAAPQHRPGHGPRDPGLPGTRRRTGPARQLGLHRGLRAEGRHQASRRADPPRRHRLPQADGGRHPLHVQHDGLPGSHVRPALPPLRQGQRARQGQHGDRRPHDRPRGDHRAGARLRRQHRRHRAAPCRTRGRPDADRLQAGALRGRARRAPRDAHRPRRPRHDVGRHRRVGHGVVCGHAARAAHRPEGCEEGARQEGARQEGARQEGARQEGARKKRRKKAPAKKAPAKKAASAEAIGSNPTRRYGSSGSRSLGPR